MEGSLGSMLAEQKKINMELQMQMRQMQQQMQQMVSSKGDGMSGGMGGSMGPMDGNGGAMGGRGGSAGGMGGYNGGSSSMGGYNGGPASMVGPWSGNSSYAASGNLGRGYGDGFGGGKMTPTMRGGGGERGPYYGAGSGSWRKDGDWDCPGCGNVNYHFRIKCNKCDKAKPEGMGGSSGDGQKDLKQIPRRPFNPNRRPGDWDCNKCGNMNYASRSKCNTPECDTERPKGSSNSMSPDLSFGGGVGGGGGMGYGGMEWGMRGYQDMGRDMRNRRNGDWDCPKCGNMNYASRDKCNGRDCDFEKKDLDDMACSSRFMGGGGMGPMMGGGGMGPMMGGGGPMGGMGGGGPMGGMGGSGPMGGMGGPMGSFSGGNVRREGDWDCPRCGNLNYASREKCNAASCGLPKPDFSRTGGRQPGRGSESKKGDWACYKCGNINYANRIGCNLCSVDKETATKWDPKE